MFKKNAIKCIKLLFVSLILSIFLSIPGVANATRLLESGTWEIGVGLESGLELSSPVSSAPALTPFIGYFFTDHVEGILYAYYTTIDTDSMDVSKTRISGGLVYNLDPWNLHGLNLVPAISGLIDYVSAEGEGSGLSITSVDSFGFTIGFGIRCFIGDRGSINLENYYSTADLKYKTPLGVTSEDVGGFNTSISYSLYFR